MITKDITIENICCLYASEFHLEMILVPYIRKNMDNYKIVILSQKKLEDSVKIVLDKINIESLYKKQILNLNWNNDFLNNNQLRKNDHIIFIINGDEKYKNTLKNEILNINVKRKIIIDCIDINEVNPKIIDISNNYNAVLNTGVTIK